jgi:hypothetical protein
MNDMMMKKKGPRGLEDGVYTEDSGLPPPRDIDGGSAPKPKPKPSKPKAFAKGGSVGSASKRADGIATKGKTRGTMISMRNGGKC